MGQYTITSRDGAVRAMVQQVVDRCATCRHQDEPTDHPHCVRCVREGRDAGWEPHMPADFAPLDGRTD